MLAHLILLATIGALAPLTASLVLGLRGDEAGGGGGIGAGLGESDFSDSV